MAVAAKFRKYNGTSWEEITFPPSAHTHENLEGRIGTVEGYFNNGNLTSHPCGGMVNDMSGATIGFNDAGDPTILNKEGRYIAIATDTLDGNYNYYDFPDFDGTVAVINSTSGDLTIGGTWIGDSGIGTLGEIYVGEDDNTCVSADGVTTTGNMSCQDLYVNGTIYGGNYGGDSKYYMHTFEMTAANSGGGRIAFTYMSKSENSLSISNIYSKYGGKIFACSGIWNAKSVYKLKFENSSQIRIVYETDGVTTLLTPSAYTDTVIPVA